MSSGVYFDQDSNGAHLKLIGELRMMDCKPIVDLIELYKRQVYLGSIEIDLCDVTYLDSTLLGTLSQLGIVFKEKGDDLPQVFCPKNDVRKMLETMGMGQIFQFNESVSSHDSYIKIEGALDKKALYDQILKAHETLLNLGSDEHDSLSSFIEMLKKEGMKGHE